MYSFRHGWDLLSVDYMLIHCLGKEMMIMRALQIIGIAVLVVVPTLCLAEDAPDVFDMDFAQLKQLQVSVASARADSILDAPGIVSRYSTADLEKFGIRTLKDMLSFVPGFVLQDTPVGNAAVAIRGLSDGYNQKMLLLLDDVPYWMPSHSDAPLLGIPIEAIDHIEIVRGPASVMYGTNASAGVVRVVTKKRGRSEAALSVGQHGLVNGGAYMSYDLDADSHIDLSFERQRDGGYAGHYAGLAPVPQGFPNAGQTEGYLDRSVRMGSALMRYRRGPLNLSLHVFEQVTNGVALAGTLANYADLKYKGGLFHAGYAWTFDKAELKVYSDYNNFYLNLAVKNAIAYGVDGGAKVLSPEGQYRWRSGATLNYSPNAQFLGLLGVEFEKRTNQDYGVLVQNGFRLIVPAGKSDETALFAQGDYILNDWRFLLGGRYTSVKNTETTQNSFTPRLGVVYKLDDSQSLKLLYSKGFNVPNALQISTNLSPVLLGDRNLKPETVATTDFAYSFLQGNQLFVANVYQLQGKNFIGRHPVPGVLAQYFNTQDVIKRWGAELDYQTGFGLWRIFSNFAYNHQGNQETLGDQTVFYTPKFTLVGGGSYRWAQNHLLGGALRFVGQRANAGSLTLVDLNYQYEEHGYEIFATIHNLLNKDILQPDMLNFKPGQLVNGGDGRNLLVGVKIRF